MKQTHNWPTFEDINAFIEARVGDQPDDEGLVKLDSKWQWHSVACRASDLFGENWRDYLIQYVGVVLHSFKREVSQTEARKRMTHTGFLTILADKRIVQVRRVRILHKLTTAFIDIRYAPVDKKTKLGVVGFENVQHLKTWPEFQTEILPLWKGLALRGLIEKPKKLQKAIDDIVTVGRELDRDGNLSRRTVAIRLRGLYTTGHSDEADIKSLDRLIRSYDQGWKWRTIKLIIRGPK